MKTEEFSLDHVDAMIDFLDKHIAANTDTPAQLGALQQRLDAIDTAYRADPAYAQFYSRMLETQSLIYGRSNQDAKALQFMKEAVRQAGGVQGLRSQSIRQYIAKHHGQTTAEHERAEPHAHAQIAGRPQAWHHHAQPKPEEQSAPQIQPVQAAPIAEEAMPEFQPAQRKKRRLNPFSRLKVGFAASLLILGLLGITMYFVPQASAVPVMLANYSDIKSAKKAFEDLSAQYRACSSQLAQQKANVDTYDSDAVNAFNQATAKCQDVLHQQKQAAAKYDSLIAS